VVECRQVFRQLRVLCYVFAVGVTNQVEVGIRPVFSVVNNMNTYIFRGTCQKDAFVINGRATLG